MSPRGRLQRISCRMEKGCASKSTCGHQINPSAASHNECLSLHFRNLTRNHRNRIHPSRLLSAPMIRHSSRTNIMITWILKMFLYHFFLGQERSQLTTLKLCSAPAKLLSESKTASTHNKSSAARQNLSSWRWPSHLFLRQ